MPLAPLAWILSPDPATNPPMVLLLAPWIQMPLPPAPNTVPMLVCWTRLLVDWEPMMLTPVPLMLLMLTDWVAPEPPTMLFGEFRMRTPSPPNPLMFTSCRFAPPYLVVISTPTPTLPVTLMCRSTTRSGVALGFENWAWADGL